MPHPKKRQSKARSSKRRSAWMGILNAPKLVPCPKCSTPKLPHVVCSTCGTYKGEQVIEIKERMTRKDRRAAEKAAAEEARKEEKAAKEAKKDKK